MLRSIGRTSGALALVVLLGCEGRQDLTQHYGATSPPASGGGDQGGSSGSTGSTGGLAGSGTGGSVSLAGAGGVPSFGAAGAAGNTIAPSPPGEPAPVQIAGCPQGFVHPGEEIVACGLSPTADLVAVDEGGFVISRRTAGGLQRIDRTTGVMALIDDRPANRGWRSERPSPIRGTELFLPDATAGTLEAIDLRTGAHRLLTSALTTTTPEDLDGALIALDETRVYLRAAPTGEIGSLDLAASGALPLAIQGAPSTSPRVVDGGYVYVEQARVVRRFPVAGGSLEDVLAIPQPENDPPIPLRPGSWTVAAGVVYWTDDGGFNGEHRVVSRPVDGGETSVLGTYPDQECSCPPSRLQVRDGRLSFHFYTNFFVSSVGQADRTPKQIFPAFVAATSIVFAGGYAYTIGTRGGGEGPLEGYLSRVPLP